MEILELDKQRRLAYWDSGSGPPLVLVHGAGTSGELWAEDVAELARDCRYITYDRRGFGASSEAAESWEAQTDDAIDLIEALDAAPCVLVGFSGGSIIVLDLVLRRPELVRHLVLLDPAFNVRRCLTPGLVWTVAKAQLLRRIRGERRGIEPWLRYVTRSAFEDAPPERRERILDNAGAIFADLGGGGGEHVDESRFAGIAVPVTLVEAEQSPPFLRRSCARLKGLIPQAETIALERSGHAVNVQARDDVVSILGQIAGRA